MKTCPKCQVIYPSSHSVCPQDGSPLESFQGWQPGDVVQGKFRIVKKIGVGQTGDVFEADHLALKETRALKLLVGLIAREEALVQLLRQEVRAARALNHSNAVRIEDVQRAEKGLIFLVLEHVTGENLADIVRRTGPMPPVQVIENVRQICSALERAHSFGIIHGDIRPHNVLLVRQPGDKYLVKVLDFGLAKFKQAVAERGIEIAGVSKTSGGFAVGTPPYIAPEQAKGISGQVYDRRSDLYSLGVLMYEALSGEPAWPPDSPADAPPLPLQTWRPDLELPDLVAGIVTKAIEKNLALRFQSASEMALSLSMAEELLVREAEIAKLNSGPLEGNKVEESSSPSAGAPAGASGEPEVASPNMISQSRVSPLPADGGSRSDNLRSGSPAGVQSTEILEGEPLTPGSPDRTGKFRASSLQIESMFETPSLLMGDVVEGGEANTAALRETKDANLTADQAREPEARSNSRRRELLPKAAAPMAVQNVPIRPTQPSKAEPVRSPIVSRGTSGRLSPPQNSGPVRDSLGAQNAPRAAEQAVKVRPAPKLFGLSPAWGSVTQPREGGPFRIILIALTFVLLVLLAVRFISHLAPWAAPPSSTETNHQTNVAPSSPPNPTSPAATATPTPETTAPPPPTEANAPVTPKETTGVSPPAPSGISDLGVAGEVPPSMGSEPPAEAIETKPSVRNPPARAHKPRLRTSPRSLTPARKLSPAQEAELRDKLVIAGFLMDREDYRGAIEAFGAALKIDPTNREAQSGLQRARQASNAQKATGNP